MNKKFVYQVGNNKKNQLQHVSVLSPSSGSVQYELAKVTFFLKQPINLHWCG
jgi:hypothetical protein